MSNRYDSGSIETEFQPGSRGRVLRNLPGIVRVADMQHAESAALDAVQEWAIGHYHLAIDTPCVGMSADRLALALARTHAELVLIHPFRDGNGRCARLLAVLMAMQAGLPGLDFGSFAGRGRRRYFAAIHAAIDRNYGPLQECFARAIRLTSGAFGKSS